MTPRTEAGKAAETTLPHFDTCAGMRGPNPCDCGVVSTIFAIEDQAATEADLRLLIMTTARDAAVVEADLLREAATEARRELLAKVEGLPHWDAGEGTAVIVGAEVCNWHAVLRLIEESLPDSPTINEAPRHDPPAGSPGKSPASDGGERGASAAALPDDGREKGPPSDVEGGPAGATGAVSVQGDSTPDDGRQGLDELRALSDAATPGPWTHGRTNWRRQRTDWWGIFPPRRIGTLPMFSLPPRPIVYLEDEELDQADAAFIVGAVNYVRSLIPADKP